MTGQDHNDMQLDENLRLVSRHVAMPAPPSEAQRSRWESVLEGQDSSVPRSTSAGARVPRSNGLRIAAVAAAIAIVFGLWFTAGDRADPNAAFAQFADELNRIHSVKFVQSNNHGVRTVHYQVQDGRWRREVSNNWGYRSIGVFDGRSLAWYQPAKKYVDIQHNPYLPGFSPKPIWEDIKEKIAAERQFLGEREFEGVSVLGYSMDLPDMGAFTNRTEAIWIDSNSHLPVEVVSESVFSYSALDEDVLEREKARLGRLVHDGVLTQNEADKMLEINMMPTKVVDTYRDFQWNVKLDSSLFEIETPNGWKIHETDHGKHDDGVRSNP